MKILIPDVHLKYGYVDDLATALESRGHRIFWNGDRIFDQNFHPDAILSQWPEGYIRGLELTEVDNERVKSIKHILKEKRKRTLIISFVHNVLPRPTKHRKTNRLLKTLFEVNYSSSHGFIHLGKKSILDFEKQYPQINHGEGLYHLVNHGLFENLRNVFGTEANLPLKIEANASQNGNFTIFVPGTIRYWSEISFLLNAFSQSNLERKRIIIAGGGQLLNGRHPLKWIRRRRIESSSDIQLFARRLSDEELCHCLIKADIVISPRLEATNSGIPYLAATFGKRCIGPEVGNVTEAVKHLDGLLFDTKKPESLTKSLETAFAERDTFSMPAQPCPTWNEIARNIETFLVSLRNRTFPQSIA